MARRDKNNRRNSSGERRQARRQRPSHARRRRGYRWGLLLLMLGAAGLIGNRLSWPRQNLSPRDGAALSQIGSWGYQLQKVRSSRIARSIELLVVDYSRDGTDQQAFNAKDLARLRDRGPDRAPRLILAYLSIGEAERYRYYWWSHWRYLKPGWLGQENKEWRGNYPVRFWQAGWQSIILRPKRTALDALLERAVPWSRPYLDRILEAGFDGVYLDRVDVFYEWEDERKTADKSMMRFVETLSRYARARKKGFLIVPQNGEELLRFSRYRKAIDAIAKEDLYYGVEDDGQKNEKREVRKTLRYLNKAHKEGLPVFVVEYLRAKRKRLSVQRRTQDRGYILHFARRALDKPPRVLKPLPPPPPPPQDAVPADQPAHSQPRSPAQSLGQPGASVIAPAQLNTGQTGTAQ